MWDLRMPVNALRVVLPRKSKLEIRINLKKNLRTINKSRRLKTKQNPMMTLMLSKTVETMKRRMTITMMRTLSNFWIRMMMRIMIKVQVFLRSNKRKTRKLRQIVTLMMKAITSSSWWKSKTLKRVKMIMTTRMRTMKMITMTTSNKKN